MASLTLLDPTAQPEGLAVSLAPRPPGLRGRRLGLVDNTKANAGALLEEVLRLLQEELQPSQVVRVKVPATFPAAEAVLDEIAGQVDLVIEAVGD